MALVPIQFTRGLKPSQQTQAIEPRNPKLLNMGLDSIGRGSTYFETYSDATFQKPGS